MYTIIIIIIVYIIYLGCSQCKQHKSDNIYNKCNFVVNNASKLHCFYRICIYMHLCMYTHNYNLYTNECTGIEHAWPTPPIQIEIIIIMYI